MARKKQIKEDLKKSAKKIELAEKYYVNSSSITRIIQNKSSIQEQHKRVTETDFLLSFNSQINCNLRINSMIKIINF